MEEGEKHSSTSVHRVCGFLPQGSGAGCSTSTLACGLSVHKFHNQMHTCVHGPSLVLVDSEGHAALFCVQGLLAGPSVCILLTTLALATPSLVPLQTIQHLQRPQTPGSGGNSTLHNCSAGGETYAQHLTAQHRVARARTDSPTCFARSSASRCSCSSRRKAPMRRCRKVSASLTDLTYLETV